MTAFSQVQISTDVTGSISDGLFGTSVAISADGKTFVAGAPSDMNSTEAGQVKVYHMDVNRNWSLKGLAISGANPGDLFGQSVDISADGNRIAVGAMHDDVGNDDPADNRGSVKVFEFANGLWTQVGQTLVGDEMQDWNGASVSLSDDGLVVAIAAPMSDHSASNGGSVRVFGDRDGVWLQAGDDIVGEYANLFLGTSVDLSSSGQSIAIGMPGFDGAGTDRGAVRVYDLAFGNWTSKGAGMAGQFDGDMMGSAVSLSSDGKRVACGASQYDDGTGYVLISEFADGTWFRIGERLVGDDKPDNFGSSVALSHDGNSLAVGISNDSDEHNSGGQVRHYMISGPNGEWEQTGNAVFGDAVSDNMGTSVAISAQNDYVVMGAPSNGNPTSEMGMVKVFRWIPPAHEPVSIPEKNLVDVYPNPANLYANVSVAGYKEYLVTLTDIHGEVVLSEENAIFLDLHQVQVGDYVLKVISKGDRLVKSMPFSVHR